jgi:hypothetical protein
MRSRRFRAVAASRKPRSRPWRARDASSEKANASARKATIRTTATARLPPSDVVVADSADRTVTVTWARPKPVSVWLTARYALPSTVRFPAVGGANGPGNATVEASILGPSLTASTTPGEGR